MAKEELVPKIEAMRVMLSKQGHRTDLAGQPAGKTFVEWLDDNKDVLGSRATVYRLMKKGGGGEITPKKFKIGDRLQEKGSTPVCIVTNLHAVNDEDGTQAVDVRFELDGAERLDVPTSGFHKFKAPVVELNDLRTFEDAEYIIEAAADGTPKFTRTKTPTEAEAAKIAADAEGQKSESTEADKKLGALVGTKSDAPRVTKKVGTKKAAVVKPPKGTPGPKKGAKAEKARLAAEAGGVTITRCTPGEGIEAGPSKLEVELDAAAAERKAERDADADTHRETLMGTGQVVEPITAAETQ